MRSTINKIEVVQRFIYRMIGNEFSILASTMQLKYLNSKLMPKPLSVVGVRMKLVFVMQPIVKKSMKKPMTMCYYRQQRCYILAVLF